MYFKQLELVGFKSFANKTILDFEPGVTAVVGPNGCGKSNIFDGIRWVLGEQSVKALRGSQMEDVIFNGTDSKEPLGMAEITLTFDNHSRVFPVDHDEVAITRRIFRSGESEYLLNKSVVRLKDITDILLGTGIGAESYSLIQQGKIDLVLSSKPEERRMVFDEASGITKYKAQKREALRKLEETEQNLLRLNDIITEVKRQIGSLERQANKARRYKEVFEDLKSKETLLGIAQKNAFLQEKESVSGQLAQLASDEAGLLESIQQQEQVIASRKAQLEGLEAQISAIKDDILRLGNTVSRNLERIRYNQERIQELAENKKYLEAQTEQTRARLAVDEEKLAGLRAEYNGIKQEIAKRVETLESQEKALHELTLAIQSSLERIAQAKKDILTMAAKVAAAKNDITDVGAKQQILLARKKRLEIEKAKTNEEKAAVEENVNAINQEVRTLAGKVEELRLQVAGVKGEKEKEATLLGELSLSIDGLEKQRLTLESQKAFLDELRTKYEDISESMNAVIYLDKVPAERMSGLVVKIKEYMDQASCELNVKISGEAKPIDLDTQRITEKIVQIQAKIDSLKSEKALKQARIDELEKTLACLEEEEHSQEMILVNRKASQQTALEQFDKIKAEEEIILLELSDVGTEITGLEEKSAAMQCALIDLEKGQRESEDAITTEQAHITANNGLKEQAIVVITQTKTELEGLRKRITTDEATLKMVQDAYEQDKESLLNLQRQCIDSDAKTASLENEIKDMSREMDEANRSIEARGASLKQTQQQYDQTSGNSEEVLRKIETDKKELDGLKNKLYELQMHSKDIDYKYLAIKERILQSYKVDLDTLAEPAAATEPAADEAPLAETIQKLKDKLDSYGTVNLVAIEEYDELKKRYDFLTQQQTDLTTAKDSLQEAIRKINHTTKKMFLETFEKVREEFRNYFRLLFNGGDAQIYLIDEQDPLESGIEIICRPPGKKLQNVLLLSGGEKSMSAIALIFAIFKVKPAPFCVLDEIDAALDEANVDRFGRMLQEFAKISQFIVITHNKKTIANADVMYGITMEESGVSKIVSVKLSQNKAAQAPIERTPAVAPAA
ncbi:MAG TPA: AAA family ATPase [Patescibacteria group bacterium]|nr:AAA family ATPase [Patescibacteria group bacterium]